MCEESHKRVKEAVAKGWYYPKTENKTMDVDLAEAISIEVDSLFHQLQDENEKYKTALEKLARLGNEPQLGNSDGNIIAQQALTGQEGS